MTSEWERRERKRKRRDTDNKDWGGMQYNGSFLEVVACLFSVVFCGSTICWERHCKLIAICNVECTEVMNK